MRISCWRYGNWPTGDFAKASPRGRRDPAGRRTAHGGGTETWLRYTRSVSAVLTLQSRNALTMQFRKLLRARSRSTRELDAKLREEIDSHVLMCAEALERKGLGRERVYTIRQNFTIAWRQARRAPGVSSAVILTLALGMGANAAMFGMVDRLLLRPPSGVHQPRELRRLYWRQTFPWSGLTTMEAAPATPTMRCSGRRESPGPNSRPTLRVRRCSAVASTRDRFVETSSLQATGPCSSRAFISGDSSPRTRTRRGRQPMLPCSVIPSGVRRLEPTRVRWESQSPLASERSQSSVLRRRISAAWTFSPQTCGCQ